MAPAPVPVLHSGPLQAGQRLDDFEILAVLGSGSFAHVYLARQVSLNRQVALKVSANRGNEARTLASLEHEHIVHVFSETVDPASNLRLLCMQFVSGTTLERILAGLWERHPATWSGSLIVELIDDLSTQPAPFDPAALRDREALAAATFVEAVCWLGARLAEALAHAHSQGVLHRDIKPANILLNRYGRPLLADFNIALDPERAHGATGAMFGGTLRYMAPEHLDAFNPAVRASPEVVDARSDIYALGIVLYELLTGKTPPEPRAQGRAAGAVLQEWTEQRRAGPLSPRAVRPELPEVVDRVVRRCLQPAPEHRYQTAAELARALEGCRELTRAERELPAAGPVTRAAQRHPLLVFLAVLFLPQFLGTAVSIVYNATQIVAHLPTPDARQAFDLVTIAYDVPCFTTCFIFLYVWLTPLNRVWRLLDGPSLPDAEMVAAARRRALRLPTWVWLLGTAGWVLGGIAFPLGLDALTGELHRSSYLHFAISFTLAGLIAVTYSVFGTQYLVVRVFYPKFWVDGQGLRRTAARELGGSVQRRLRWFQIWAGVIPLLGAVLLINMDTETFSAGGLVFRVLVTLLIGLGMVGIMAALTASGRISQTVAAFIGSSDRRLQGDSVTSAQP
jgi:serine/threonine protein kinase